MNVIFTIKDKRGKIINLSKERWSHIKQKHPNIGEASDIENAIKNPIKEVFLEENIVVDYIYFKNRKEPARYLKVIVKYLNGEGYVITAYFVKSILK